jgi:hypothetical protein
VRGERSFAGSTSVGGNAYDIDEPFSQSADTAA